MGSEMTFSTCHSHIHHQERRFIGAAFVQTSGTKTFTDHSHLAECFHLILTVALSSRNVESFNTQ